MDASFYTPNNSMNTRDILKHLVNETTKFRMAPNHIYRMRTLRKAYQFLVIFACFLYGQGSIETFP